MRKMIPGTLAFLVLIALPVAAQTDVTIVLLGDTHSHLDSFGPRDHHLRAKTGGMARLATVLKRLRASEPNLMAVQSGDVLQGSLWSFRYFGVPEFRLLQQMGFTAMVVGNHDLGEYGPDALIYALNEAFGTNPLPLLSANLDFTARPALAAWIQPSILKEAGGVKVGIFGLTVPNSGLTRYDPVTALGGDDPAVLLQIAGAQVASLRAAGADVVLLLSHLGLAYDEAIAANVPGIDAILGGHDHLLFPQPKVVENAGGRTIIVQPGIHTRQVVRMRLTCGAGAPVLAAYEVIPLDVSVPEDPEVKAAVESLKPGLREAYGDVCDTAVATASRDIPSKFDPGSPMRDTAMGNLVTDALRARTGTMIAMTALGLISEGLYKGPLLPADIVRPVAYGYDEHTGLGLHIVTLEITGAELIKAIETTLAYLDVSIDFFLQTSGLTFSYDPRRAVGERVLLETVRVQGAPLDPAATYTMTVNEGVAALIPVMGVEVSNLQIGDDLEYFALRDYVTERRVVDSHPVGRIIDASVPVDDEDPCSASVSASGLTTSGGILAAVVAILLTFSGLRLRTRS